MTERTSMEMLQAVLESGYTDLDIQDTRDALEAADAEGTLGRTAVGQKLVKRLADVMIEKKDTYMNGHYTSKESEMVFEMLSVETVAAMTASALIDGACGRIVRQEVAAKLADGLIEVILMEKVCKEDKKAKMRIEKRMEDLEKVFKHDVYEKMISALTYYANTYGVDLDANRDGFIQIAQNFLFKMAEDSDILDFSDIVEVDEEKKVERYFSDTKCFEFNEKAHKEIDNLKEFIASNTTKFRPMVCKPRPWVSMYSGGYLTEKYQSSVRLVKGFMSLADRAAYDQELTSSERIGTLFSALNAIQETAYVVNRDVLKLAKSIYNADMGIMGIPKKAGAKIPKNLKFNELKKAVKAEAGRKSKLIATEATISIADEFSEYTEIFMPYNLDFRGRAYCVVPTLNPQGTDLQKAMLLFSKPCKLGKSGYRWLKIHAANCYGHGLDKASKKARVAWVDKNTQLIKMVASGDIKKQTFRELMQDKDRCPEDSMLFYAVCKELDQLKSMSESEIENFESHIPVSVDGSNNGLQHYAALLRNTVLAEKVNLHILSDSDIPSDVYMKVAEGMINYFKKNKSACSADIASKLKASEGVVRKAIAIVLKLEGDKHRKLVKRPTMTQAYSVSEYGMQKQIKGVVEEMFTTDKTNTKAIFISKEEVADIISRVIFEGFMVGLSEHCSAAKEGMDFLQAVADAKNDEIKWVTPSGFVAKQHYKKVEEMTINTRVGKKNMRVKYAKYTDALNSRKQVSAIAPNFVHSMDASHMMLTVNSLLNMDDFIPSFFMIHDSFGTYAGQLDALDAAIREQFVCMYSVNQFENFLNQVELSEEQLEDHAESLKLPEFGDFDLNDVKKATYFFA